MIVPPRGYCKNGSYDQRFAQFPFADRVVAHSPSATKVTPGEPMIVFDNHIPKIRALEMAKIAHQSAIERDEQRPTVIVRIGIAQIGRPKDCQGCLSAAGRSQNDYMTLARKIQDLFL